MRKLAAGMFVACAFAASAACGTATDRDAGRAAATRVVTETAEPTPVVTVTKTQRQRAPAPDPPEYEAEPDFVRAYESAGIKAPPDWAFSTAEQVCAEWGAGSSTAETDAILLEGGIYDYHVREFSDLIEAYFCPGLQP